MLEAKRELERSRSQVAAEEMMKLVDQQKVEEVMDEDIEDLLSWTNALNFDE